MRARIRRWAMLAALGVTASHVLQLAFAGVPLHPMMFALEVSWAIFIGLSVRRPAWTLAAGLTAVTLMTVFGWTAVMPTILLSIALGVRLPLKRALGAFAGLMLAMFVGLSLFGTPQPYPVRFVEVLVTCINNVFFGVALRRALLAQRESQALAGQVRAVNDLLRRDLGVAESLATARERTRVARELHDDLGHALSSAHVHAQIARREAPKNATELGEALDQVDESVRQAMQELRSAVAVLRDVSNTEPLPERFANMLDRLPTDVLGSTLEVEGQPRRLVPAKEFALFRVLQEALTNVAKHARASSVDVRLSFGPGRRVELTVVDDGIGAEHIRPGFGLKGMQERLDAVGGHLSVKATRGGGFEVTATMEDA